MAAELRPAGTAPRGVVAVIGFMGAGKSTAAASVARAVGASAVDVDSVIEERLGKPIGRIFAEDGEAAFRAAEEELTLELLGSGRDDVPRILALGGGAVESAAVRAALADHLVVWIDVDVDTAWARCRGSGRPLASDRVAFERRHAEREPLYDQLADIVVPHERSHRLFQVLQAAESLDPAARLLWAASASGDYPVYIGSGLLGPEPFWPVAVSGRRFLVSDGRVARLYGERLAPFSGQATIMPGEQSKTIAHAEIVWSELARAGMTRADVVVALGRRRRRGPGRVLCRDLSARCALRPGSDDAGGPGRLGLWRQDRRRPGGGQELRRRLPPAPGGDRRSARADTLRPRSSPPATPRSSRRH